MIFSGEWITRSNSFLDWEKEFDEEWEDAVYDGSVMLDHYWGRFVGFPRLPQQQHPLFLSLLDEVSDVYNNEAMGQLINTAGCDGGLGGRWGTCMTYDHPSRFERTGLAHLIGCLVSSEMSWTSLPLSHLISRQEKYSEHCSRTTWCLEGFSSFLSMTILLCDQKPDTCCRADACCSFLT